MAAKNSGVNRRMLGRNIKEMLAEEIIRGGMPAGTPVMSSKMLAEKHGVSFITANNAINALVRDGLLYRIHGSGTYVAERAAAPMKRLSVGVSGKAEDFLSGLASDISIGMFYQAGLQKLADSDCDTRRLSFAELHDRKNLEGLDGLLLSHGFVDNETRPLLRELNAPVVTFQHEYASEEPFHQVVPHMKAGYMEAAALLASKGRREIWLASGFGRHSENRMAVFTDCARECGVDTKNIHAVTEQLMIGDLGRAAGQRVGARILKKTRNASIFCTSDFISFGIMDEILKAGLKPGKDVDLVSFDDLESDGVLPFGRPVLTSVYNPRKEISAYAAEFLLEAIRGGVKHTHIVRLPTRLVARETA